MDMVLSHIKNPAVRQNIVGKKLGAVLEVGRYETVYHTGTSWRSSNHNDTFLRTK
jgi:hypothetical protein